MRHRLLAVRLACLLLLGCGSVYDDTGAPDPASWWPWVCEDGGLAPEAGCPAPPPECSDDAGMAPDGACLNALVECEDGGLEADGACATARASCPDGAATDGGGGC